VLNVHERLIHASPDRVGKLIDALGSRQDRLWPRDRWPAMRLDRPLGVGASGGHGPIRYTVEAYEPCRRVTFRFTVPRGFVGTHAFEVEPAGADQAWLRHKVKMRLRGPARLSWPLFFRWLHDALIEDALDRARAEAEETTVRVRRWPPRVRLLRRLARLLG